MWKINTDRVRVQKDAILSIAKAMDTYYRPNTVVLYNPGNFENDYERAETIRKTVQSAYASSLYKRSSIKIIDRMPKIIIDAGIINTINYYDVLMDKVGEHILSRTKLNPQIGIIIQGLEETYETQGAVHYCKVDVHILINNLTTYSIIIDNIAINGEGVGMTRKSAYKNAIKDAFDTDKTYDINNSKFRTTFMGTLWDEANRYYSYIMDGREVIVELQRLAYNNDTRIYRKFKDKLNNKCGVKIISDNDGETSKIFKVSTQAISQSAFVDLLNGILLDEMHDDFKNVEAFSDEVQITIKKI